MYIDSHAHLTANEVFNDLSKVLSRAQKCSVSKIINICTDQQTLDRGIEVSKEYNWIYCAGATTPHDVEKEGASMFPIFKRAAQEGKLIAVGETGLDYFYEHSPKKLQQEFLKKYLTMASDLKLPVIIHCREAFNDLKSIICDYYPSNSILLHCFTGTEEEAFLAVEEGWMISISGIVTFKNSGALRNTVSKIPMDRLMVETDTPYLAPQSKRGLVNEPSYIGETVKMLSEVKSLSEEDIASITAANACRFFHI